PPEETTFVTQKFELTSDTEKIENNIRSMSASGGGDGPEAVSDALNVANRMEYLRDAAKVMILIGDAPPQGVEEGDRWPDGTPSGIKWKEEIKKAYEKGIVIHTVGCFPEIQNYQNAVKTFQKIAADTEGKFIPLNEAELLVKVVTGVAIEEIDKLAIQDAILREMGVSMDKFEEGEEITDEKIAELASKMHAGGLKKRSLHHAPMAAGAPAAAEKFEMAEEEVSTDDIKEAVRQLRSKRKGD
ncbi:MAG: VWA domain-containing protein, partial [Candidatus Thorarchaeota archaeon]|nr:VWA domain-containing protein [Candidatus Thorarchaeota archaeon]